MNAKKLLAWLMLICLLLASVTACADQNKSPNPTEQTTDAPVDKTPVMVEDEATDFWKECDAGFDQAKEGIAAHFETKIENGAVTILSYKGSEEHLIVPATIDGLPVIAIADGAFAVPEEEENQDADEDTEEKPPLPQLKTLILPDSVTAIGEGILARCKSLHSLQTPLLGANKESQQYLGYLFGATKHEDNARDVPASLACLRLTGEWQTISAFTLFDCNDLICLSLPQSVTVVEKYALFNCASLRQIDGFENVITFGDRALMNCSALQTVTVGNQAQSLGFGVLEGCNSIRALTLPFVGHTQAEHTYLGYLFGAVQPDFAKGFYPKNLARITLTSTCTTLGDYAFYQCETLKEITIPEGLTSIGVRAFYGCESLWSIQLPNTLTTIREFAFAGCDSLTTVDFGTGLAQLGINAFHNCDSLAQVTLPQTLTKLPASCFAGCIALTSVDLGGVREVGAQAFRHCNAITTACANGEVAFADGNDAIKNLLK